MDLLSRWKTAHLTSDEETAEYLRQPPTSGYTVAIQSPRSDSVPPTIPAVIQSLREPRTGLLGVGNRSPTLCYELRRSTPDRLRLQLTLPTKRLARTFRTQLQTQIPGIGFAPGADGLPIAADMVVAGATLRPTKEAYYLVRTEFSAPPMNHLVASLHRLAMQRTRFLVQILAQPIAGQPVRKWAHGKLARKQMDYLQKEKEKLWGRRSPPRREREQARQIEAKVTRPQWRTSIRIVVMQDREDHVVSRIQQVANAFRVFECDDSGQALQTRRIEAFREAEVMRFVEAVALRTFGPSSAVFHASDQELGAVLSVPCRDQQNLPVAQPA